MAGGIREFARLRFQSAETLRKSAADFNDPIRDTYWLERLIQAKNYFYNDPLALATVYKYFPNLYRLFITALAATGDYGYSEEDPLNNHKQIMENMFKAFGTNEDGESVFKPVWAIDNFTTAQKMQLKIQELFLTLLQQLQIYFTLESEQQTFMCHQLQYQLTQDLKQEA
jgi:hypothetical protein